MRKKLSCIMLVDDNDADNFFHRIIIEQMNVTEKIHIAENGLEAMNYLKNGNQLLPELIFLDINMPKMNGWEFLEEYKKLDPSRKAKIVIEMLTTSANPDDIRRAEQMPEVNGYEVKPLNNHMVEKILDRFFSINGG